MVSLAAWPMRSTSVVALIDTKLGSWATTRGSLVQSTGIISTEGLWSSQCISPGEPTVKVATCLLRCWRLRAPVATPRSTRSISQRLGVDAQIAVITQRRQQRIGDGSDADLKACAVRNQLGDMPGDRLILRRRLAAGDRREPGFVAYPTGQLAGVNLVLTVCEWLSRGDLEEKWHLTDDRGGEVGVGAQAELAVFVGAGSTGPRQRGVGPAQH